MDIGDDLLTLDEDDLVDITEDAIEAIADERINIVKCLGEEKSPQQIYTISRGKLVPVSQVADFRKYHATTMSDARKVDITEDAIEAIGDESITSEKCLGNENSPQQIYTISRGKLVPVSKVADFQKYHATTISDAGKVISLDANQVISLSGNASVNTLEKSLVRPRKLPTPAVSAAQKIPQVSISVPGPLDTALQTIANALSGMAPQKVHVSVDVVNSKTSEAEAMGSTTVVPSTILEENSGLTNSTNNGLPLSLPGPITYINGVPGQIVNGEQLQQLQAILGYQPQIIPPPFMAAGPTSNTAASKVSQRNPSQPGPLREGSGFPKPSTSQRQILPKGPIDLARDLHPSLTSFVQSKPCHERISPINITPSVKIPKATSAMGLSAVRGRKNLQGGISQTVIAKESVTYQREKYGLFGEHLVLSPLIPPAVTETCKEDADRISTHLSDSINAVRDITKCWNMQGCVTYGADIQAQVFAPRLLLPEPGMESEGIGGSTDCGGEYYGVMYPELSEFQEETVTVNHSGGLYGSCGFDMVDSMFTKNIDLPCNNLGDEMVFDERQGGSRPRSGQSRSSLLEEVVEDDRSDEEVEFSFGDQYSSKKVRLNLQMIGEYDDANQWMVIKTEAESPILDVDGDSQDKEMNITDETQTSTNVLPYTEIGTVKAVTSNDADTKLDLKLAASQLVEKELSAKNTNVFDKYVGYACYYCLYVGSTRKALFEHWIERHKPFKPYTCPYCMLDFGVSCNVISHITLNHPGKKSVVSLNNSPIYKEKVEICANTEETLTCKVPTMNNAMESVAPYKRDLHATHTGFIFQCLGCSYRSPSVIAIKNHIREVHYKLQPFFCPYCSKTFDNGYLAKQHVSYQHEGMPVRVYIAKKRLRKMENHVLNNRFTVMPMDCIMMRQEDMDLLGNNLWDKGQDDRLSCKQCQYQSESRSSMYKHVVAEHRGPHGVVCPRCRYYNRLLPLTLKNGWAACEHCWFLLNLNVGTVPSPHLSEPFAMLNLCLECDYRTKDKSCLHRHLKYQHLRCRPFFCAYCTYNAVEKMKVRQHILTKHRSKPVHILKNAELSSRSINQMQGMYKQVNMPVTLIKKYESPDGSNQLVQDASDDSREGTPTATKSTPVTTSPVCLSSPAAASPAAAVYISSARASASASALAHTLYASGPSTTKPSSFRKSDIIPLSMLSSGQIAVGHPATIGNRRPQESYKCKVCEVCHHDKASMLRHVKVHHLAAKPYTCGYCNYGAPERRMVTEHAQKWHKASPTFVKTNYNLLKMMHSMSKQYFTKTGDLGKDISLERAESENESEEENHHLRPLHIDSETTYFIKVESLNGDQTVKVKQEPDEPPDNLFSSTEEKEMDVEYIGVDSIKQEVITTDPSIQQDAKLTKEPLIILEDIMHSIKFS